LSQFDGKMKTKDWSKIPKMEKPGVPAKYSTTQPPWVDPATFFDQLPAVMQQVPPMPGEEALYKLIGSVLDAAARDPAVMRRGRLSLRQRGECSRYQTQRCRQVRSSRCPLAGRCSATASSERLTLHPLRTQLPATSSDNKRNETMYFYTDNDTQLGQLDGTS